MQGVVPQEGLLANVQQINYFVLQNPRCKVCGGTPKVRSSKHLFLNLTKVAF